MESIWKTFGQFEGFQTLDDPEKITDGGTPEGFNTSTNNGDRISVRKLGFTAFPSTNPSSTPIHSFHTFRKRGGENIMMRASSETLEYFDANAQAWTVLRDNFADGKKFGFADYDINSDLKSYVYFGNGVDDFARWDGAHTTFASATVNTIKKQGGGTWSAEGFLTGGTRKVVINAIEYTYTGGEATDTLTGVTPDPTGAGITVGTPVAQFIETFPAGPKGNIYLNANNRLFISGDPNNQQVVYFTVYGNPVDFTGITTLVSQSTAASGGLFNLGEGGGAVTDMALDEGSIYIFKNSIVYKATLTDALYSIVPLKPFDSKSQTMGALGGTTFTVSNGVILVTPDNQILNLTRIDQIDYPQAATISELIDPTVANYDFTLAKGISFGINAFLACKSSTKAPVNDVVLVYNTVRRNADGTAGSWDTPIVGWNVTDWAIYDDGTGTGAILYFASSVSKNVYKVTETPIDDIYNIKANYKTKQFDFGMAAEQKVCDEYFIEGNIPTNTKITVSALLDGGFTQILTGTIDGDDQTILFQTENTLNVFGANVFGEEMFGSNPDSNAPRRFRVYFANNIKVKPFYTIQLSFDSEGVNNNWEITSYGFKIAKFSQPEDKKLYKAFN